MNLQDSTFCLLPSGASLTGPSGPTGDKNKGCFCQVNRLINESLSSPSKLAGGGAREDVSVGRRVAFGERAEWADSRAQNTRVRVHTRGRVGLNSACLLLEGLKNQISHFPLVGFARTGTRLAPVYRYFSTLNDVFSVRATSFACIMSLLTHSLAKSKCKHNKRQASHKTFRASVKVKYILKKANIQAFLL